MIKGKVKVEINKDSDIEKITAAEAEKIIETKTKKKTPAKKTEKTAKTRKAAR